MVSPTPHLLLPAPPPLLMRRRASPLGALVFAAAALLAFVGLAFAAGYLVGKLLL